MSRPKKLQDPTEAAMSAIEEALRLDQPKGETETPVEAEPRLPATSENDLRLELPRVEPAAAAPAQAASFSTPARSCLRASVSKASSFTAIGGYLQISSR